MAKKINSKYEVGKKSKIGWKLKFWTAWLHNNWIHKRSSLICVTYHKGKLKYYVGKVSTRFNESEIEKNLEKLKKIKVEKCPLEKEPELNLFAERKPTWVKPKYVCKINLWS